MCNFNIRLYQFSDNTSRCVGKHIPLFTRVIISVFIQWGKLSNTIQAFVSLCNENICNENQNVRLINFLQCIIKNSSFFVEILLRLQGPLSANGTGRLEVFFRGEWGTVCDDSWGTYDAEVACRQLGYPYAVRALYYREVPAGTGPIWLDDVGCTGNEENLRQCYHRGWGSHNCGHSEDAGVQCSLTG